METVDLAGKGGGVFFFSSRRRHTRCSRDWSSDVCSSDLDASFTDVSFKAGLGSATIPFLGWGTAFLDFDNDGLLDLFIANGHVYPIADQRDWGTTWRQRPQLFHNLDGSKFQEVPPVTGSRSEERRVGKECRSR